MIRVPAPALEPGEALRRLRARRAALPARRRRATPTGWGAFSFAGCDPDDGAGLVARRRRRSAGAARGGAAALERRAGRRQAVAVRGRLPDATISAPSAGACGRAALARWTISGCRPSTSRAIRAVWRLDRATRARRGAGARRAQRGAAARAPAAGAPAGGDVPSARLLDDRQQRGAVPDVHHRIERHLGAAGGHQDVAVAVGPRPLHGGPADEPIPRARALARGALVGDDGQRLVEPRRARDAARPAVPGAALARAPRRPSRRAPAGRRRRPSARRAPRRRRACRRAARRGRTCACRRAGRRSSATAPHPPSRPPPRPGWRGRGTPAR